MRETETVRKEEGTFAKKKSEKGKNVVFYFNQILGIFVQA
jgi:hypothetical protein